MIDLVADRFVTQYGKSVPKVVSQIVPLAWLRDQTFDPAQ